MKSSVKKLGNQLMLDCKIASNSYILIYWESSQISQQILQKISSTELKIIKS